MRRYAIRTVPRETELQIAKWAELGYNHPRTEQYKHGGLLNKLEDGDYSANIIGFVLVGKFGDPDEAARQLARVEGQFWELLDLTHEQAKPLEELAADQDWMDISTDTIVHDLLDVQHLTAHCCKAGEWSLPGCSLPAGATVVLPISDQAKEWLAEASNPRNEELRNVRINNLETGADDCKEMSLCTDNRNGLAIYVDSRPVKADALDLRIWWLTRMLNVFMPERLKGIKRRQAA